jgi:hypothetical protein
MPMSVKNSHIPIKLRHKPGRTMYIKRVNPPTKIPVRNGIISHLSANSASCLFDLLPGKERI